MYARASKIMEKEMILNGKTISGKKTSENITNIRITLYTFNSRLRACL